MSGLIITPPFDHVPPSKKKHVLRSFRRSLASEFEDVDESPARKFRRILADSFDDGVDEAPATGSKFVVLEDD